MSKFHKDEENNIKIRNSGKNVVKRKKPLVIIAILSVALASGVLFSGCNGEKQADKTTYAIESTEKQSKTKQTEEESVMETEAESTASKEEQTKSQSSQNSNNNQGLSDEFKSAMDSYEAFMNEYVDFMKKYSNSNGTDLNLLSEYADYMDKYSSVCSDFEKWGNKDMNDDELAYYIEVQTRVNKKLLEVAQ